MKTTVKCTECPKEFTKSSKAKAEQALLMHIGRKHKGNIVNRGHSGVLRQQANGVLVPVGTRSHLSHDETENIVGFIRQNQSRFANKTACFNAALEAAGVTGRIVSNSTAVSRYFNKAAKAPRPPGTKRPYTKRQKQPVVRDVHVNFCPCCGCNLQAVATGIAMANAQ